MWVVSRYPWEETAGASPRPTASSPHWLPIIVVMSTCKHRRREGYRGRVKRDMCWEIAMVRRACRPGTPFGVLRCSVEGAERALSVTYGDSSPKGRAKIGSVRPLVADNCRYVDLRG